MAAALGQNKTMRSLVLNGSSGTPFELGLTQYSAVKQFVKYLLLGVSRNSTLERVDLKLSSVSGCIKREFMWCYVAWPHCFLIYFSSQAATVHYSASLALPLVTMVNLWTFCLDKYFFSTFDCVFVYFLSFIFVLEDVSAKLIQYAGNTICPVLQKFLCK